MESKFNVQYTMTNMANAYKYLQTKKDVPFTEIENSLNEISKLFKQLNTFLGIAFNDVQSKVAIINGNRAMKPQINGFMEFISYEMGLSIHKLNGENNGKHNAPPQYKKYVSTSRSLLRMMWLMTFIRVFFNDALTMKTTDKLSGMLDHAYDEAFGEKHSWIIRKGAKVAMMAAPNKKFMIETMLGKYDEPEFYRLLQQFLGYLVPIEQTLWQFYKQNGIDKLD